MGARTGIFAGQNKWDMLRLLWLEGTVVLFIVFLILLVPPFIHAIFWPCWITIGILINITLPVYLKNKHQEVANNKQFHDCMIRWGHFDKGEFLLGFTKLVEIKPDWTDKRLKQFQESRDFFIHLQRYLTKVLVKDFHAKRMGIKEMKKFIKQFEKGAVSKDIIKKVEEGKEELKKLEKKRKEDIKTAQKELTQYDLKDLPFSYLSLDDLGIDKERLKDMYMYIGILYEEETREGHTIPFDRVAIIMDHPKEILLQTDPMEAVDRYDYDININGVKCYYICIDWELDHIPLLYLHWSENMTKAIMSESLKSQSLKYLNVKILEEFVFHKAADSTQASLKIQRLETQKDVYEDELSDTVQNFYADAEWGFGSRTGNRKEVIEAKMKTKQWKTYTGVILAVTTFIIIFIIFFNLGIGSGNIPLPSPGG